MTRMAPPGAKPARSKFREGDHVRKPQGYAFPGEVRCAFRTRAGKWRYVVEAIHEDFEGMLHIFDGDRLEPANWRPGDDEKTDHN